MAAAAQKDAEGTASDREQRFLASVQKQDRLLYLCAYLLLNLSEDADIERKMQKRVGTCSAHTPVATRDNLNVVG